MRKAGTRRRLSHTMRRMSPTDPLFPAVLPPPASIDEVLDRMQQIDAALPPRDGVACFNRLYRHMTVEVREAVRDAAFEDNRFLERLDVLFAIRYLDALARQGTPGAPRAWQPLFEARSRAGVAPLQFALAGMNAHINFDLALSLVATCEERGTAPVSGSPQHRDHLRINDILASVQDKVKSLFLAGVLAEVDVAAGNVDDQFVLWSTARARDAAWTSAEMMWALRPLPTLLSEYVTTLDRFVGFAGRQMLRPTVVV